MKVIRCCVVMGLLMLPTFLKADLDTFDICTESADQLEPDIDGGWVVWHDVRNGASNFDIYGYSLAEPNEIPICTALGNQKYCAVSGNVAVWQDERNGQRDIYAFNLLAGTSLTLPNMPLNDSLSQRYPDICGDMIVYRHETGSDYSLFTYNISSDTLTSVSVASTIQLNHAVEGSIIVWMQKVNSVYQIFMRDISIADPAVQVSETIYDQWYPVVSGNLIIWAEDRGAVSGMDLYGFDVNNSTAGEFSVYSGPGEQTRPAISGKLVVWQDRPNGQDDYDIRGLDLTAGSSFDIATDSKDDQKPAISGRTVVWQRDNSDWDIVGAEVPTSTAITVISPGSGELYLANSQMEIAWQLVEGDAPEFVEIKFSPDNGNTWPVNVATDVPFANNHYQWDSVEDVNSVQCRILMTAVGEESVNDMSDMFTVFQCSEHLTADLTGDCFVGMDDFAQMAAQWLTCGNPYDDSCRYE